MKETNRIWEILYRKSGKSIVSKLFGNKNWKVGYKNGSRINFMFNW